MNHGTIYTRLVGTIVPAFSVLGSYQGSLTLRDPFLFLFLFLFFPLPLPRVQFAPQQIAANTPGMSGCGGGNTAPAYHYIMNKYGNNPLGGLASEHFCPYTQSMWQGCSQSACTNQYVDVKDIWIYMDMNTRMMNMDDVERGREFTTDRSEDEEMETCVCVVLKYVL